MNVESSSRKTIEGLFRLINAGQVELAEVQCRKYLERHTDDINAMALLGAIYLKLGRLDEAKPLLEQTMRLEPEFAKPHEDLGTLHLKQDNAKDAKRCFEEAIRLDGGQANAYLGLANALALLGQKEEAEKAHRRFLELSPVARGLAQATELLESGKPGQAEKICDDLARKNPMNTEVLRMLARIASEDGRFIIAEGLLKRITRLSDSDHRSYVDLGLFLGQLGRYPEAIDALWTAVERKPELVSIRQRLGDYLAIVGKSDEALETYNAALQIEQNFVPALVGRGHMTRILGRKEESVGAYEAAVDVQPGYGDAWWGLASLREYELNDDQVAIMREQLEKPDVVEGDKVFLHFALARAHEARQDFTSAWRHYVDGNDLKRAQTDYDPVRIMMSHDSIIEVFDDELARRAAAKQTDGPSPIFIVGMPRSGSTLLEQILASHSQVEGTAELPYMGMLSESLGGARAGKKNYPEVLRDMSAEQFAAFGKSYLYYSRDARKTDCPYFTDKMPANFEHVGLIHLAFPNARIIDARRDPLDTCVGNFRQLFAKGKNFSYDLFECADYYLEYLRVMNHWDALLPGRVLTVRYEDVVADLDSQTRRLLEFCGLPWEDACLDFHETRRAVRTASSEQVRMPIYADAIGYWKNYESELGELRDMLRDKLDD